jgi:hypothetical protein
MRAVMAGRRNHSRVDINFCMERRPSIAPVLCVIPRAYPC